MSCIGWRKPECPEKTIKYFFLTFNNWRKWKQQVSSGIYLFCNGKFECYFYTSINKIKLSYSTQETIEKRLGSWLEYIDWLIDLFIVFNATFRNISAISWQLVLVVEEPESPEITTDHHEATSKLISFAAASRVHPFCNLQSLTFCRSLFVSFYFFFWPLYCLFFFDIRIMITPLVFPNMYM
jgi:hypothetical protein